MKRPPAFTLVELLTVIAIIAVLMGLLFPVYSLIRNRARGVTASATVGQLASAIEAYHTEYGRYPAISADGKYEDEASQAQLVRTLSGLDPEHNPKKTSFLEPAIGKKAGDTYRGGIDPDGASYVWRDPWGEAYRMRVDADHDNAMENPYSSGAGPSPLPKTVIAWSMGADRSQATAFEDGDDIASWVQ